MFCKDGRLWKSVSCSCQQMFRISCVFASTQTPANKRTLSDLIRLTFFYAFTSVSFSTSSAPAPITQYWFHESYLLNQFSGVFISEKIPYCVIYHGSIVIWTKCETAELLQEVQAAAAPNITSRYSVWSNLPRTLSGREKIISPFASPLFVAKMWNLFHTNVFSFSHGIQNCQCHWGTNSLWSSKP